MNVTLETVPRARKVERLTRRPNTAVTNRAMTTWKILLLCHSVVLHRLVKLAHLSASHEQLRDLRRRERHKQIVKPCQDCINA